jgi:4-diphosphocytidyl-2-C-methyl-D-erythritol kinase
MTDSLRWPGTSVSGRHEWVVQAPAKLNLTLAVQGRRPDGYHDIRSLVVGLHWYDLLTIAVDQGEGIRLTCEGHPVPTGADNLIWRAVEGMAHRLGCPANVSIRLNKQIPPGSGLGGGSSDAAATLWALNGLWQAGLDRPSLMELGACIGSDVPLFFNLPAAVISGRGEQVQAVPAGQKHWVLLVLPEIHTSTAQVFANWSGPAKLLTAGQNGWASWLDRGAENLSEVLFNDLERATFRTDGRLSDLFEHLAGLGLAHVRVTGSGSAMFRIFSFRAEAQQWADRIAAALNVRTLVTQTLTTDDLN